MDEQYRRDDKGIYSAHRPIYGFGKGPSQKNHTVRFGISYGILKILNRLNWETLLDVGGGEGYIAKLARDLFQREAFTSEISVEANLRAKEYYGLSGITADIQRLPFKDNSFDIVLASEVIEHLQYPLLGLYEISRVASKAIVFTTAEAYASEKERDLRLKTRNFAAPHGERNYWHPDDFKKIFKGDVRILTCTRAFMDVDEKSIEENEAKEIVKRIAPLDTYNEYSLDALILIQKENISSSEGIIDDDEILEKLFDFKVDYDYREQNVTELPKGALCCPLDQGELKKQEGEWICASCAEIYAELGGVPLLISQKPIVPPPDDDKIRTAGLNPDELRKLENLFSKEEKRSLKVLTILYLVFLMFLRFIKSDVHWKIKLKWLKNKTNFTRFFNYFLK